MRGGSEGAGRCWPEGAGHRASGRPLPSWGLFAGAATGHPGRIIHSAATAVIKGRTLHGIRVATGAAVATDLLWAVSQG